MRAMGLAGAVRGRAWVTTTHAAMARITLRLAHPLAQRLGGAPQLGSHRLQHSPLRRVRLAMLLDHPDRSLPHRYCQVPHVWRHHDE